MNHLLEIGAIVRCAPCKDQFLSRIFIIPKTDGSRRLILNLKNLNAFLSPDYFKLEDRNTVTKLLVPNNFLATIDLTEAYHLIPIHSFDRKYLRFQFRNKLYEYTCLPFGLCTAPIVYTKLLKPVVAYLRAKSLCSVGYLNVFLLLGRTLSDCERNVHETIKTIECLGFVVNREKSKLTPDRTCKFWVFF